MLDKAVRRDELREWNGLLTGKLQRYQSIKLHSLKWLFAILAGVVKNDEMRGCDSLLTGELQ